jgi:hypothetical protein
MTIYDDMQGIAQEVFADFKQGTVIYVAKTAGNGPVDDPGASTETQFTLVGQTVSGVSKKYVDNGLAIGTDLQIRMSFDSRFVPDNKGFFIVDGVRCKILQVDKVPAAGPTIAYVIPIRKGG